MIRIFHFEVENIRNKGNIYISDVFSHFTVVIKKALKFLSLYLNTSKMVVRQKYVHDGPNSLLGQWTS
jgi:hypothetical protein